MHRSAGAKTSIWAVDYLVPDIESVPVPGRLRNHSFRKRFTAFGSNFAGMVIGIRCYLAAVIPPFTQ